MKIAIYTANIGGNVNNFEDDLHHYEEGVDYYYFTDDRTIKSEKWNIVYVNNDCQSCDISPGNRKFAKKIKIIYWEFLKGYDWVVWVDAHHVLKQSVKNINISNYISSLPHDIDIVFKNHTGFMPKFDKNGNVMFNKNGVVLEERKFDLYDEIKHIKYHPDAKLENMESLKKWEVFLKKIDFPRRSGLIETNKIIWRVKFNNLLRNFNHVWFKYSTEKFRRDQLTLNFLLWRDRAISNYVVTDNLDDVLPTEKVKWDKKTEKGLEEWSGKWE
jgi:hypothetical protein